MEKELSVSGDRVGRACLQLEVFRKATRRTVLLTFSDRDQTTTPYDVRPAFSPRSVMVGTSLRYLQSRKVFM